MAKDIEFNRDTVLTLVNEEGFKSIEELKEAISFNSASPTTIDDVGCLEATYFSDGIPHCRIIVEIWKMFYEDKYNIDKFSELLEIKYSSQTGKTLSKSSFNGYLSCKNCRKRHMVGKYQLKVKDDLINLLCNGLAVRLDRDEIFGKTIENISDLKRILAKNKKEDFKLLFGQDKRDEDKQKLKPPKGFVGGGWIKGAVNTWLNDENSSSVLWLKAEAGFGKSAISSYLACEHTLALGVHYCQFDNTESQKAIKMLKTLIFKISEKIEAYEKELQDNPTIRTIILDAENPGEILETLLINTKINEPEKKYFFIIDGLDESYREGESEIVELISTYFLRLPPWLNIVITSRDEDILTKKLTDVFTLELDSKSEKNKNDLNKYLNDKNLNKELIEPLIAKSAGNILYLKSILELNNLTLEAINKLPTTIEDFYLNHFKRQFPEGELDGVSQSFLNLLVVQKGSPDILMQDMLGIDNKDYKEIKSKFGSLLKVEEGILTFYHKSIFDWLSARGETQHYSIDVDKGEESYTNFIGSLTSNNYKEEYLKFTDLNANIIRYIHNNESSLKIFLKLLSNYEHEKIIDLLHLLTLEYRRINNEITIQLGEMSLSIIKQLYKKDKITWVKLYSQILKSLAVSYFLEKNNNKKMREYLEEYSQLIKEQYNKNPGDWIHEHRLLCLNNSDLENLAVHVNNLKTIEEENFRIDDEKYLNVLETIRVLYFKNNQLDKAIETQNKCVSKLGNLTKKNHTVWLKKYEEAQKILEALDAKTK